MSASTQYADPPPMSEPYDPQPEPQSLSLGTLIKDLRDETLNLFKQEIALVRTEVGEKISQAGKDAAKIPAGALIAYLGLVLLLIGVSFLGAFGLAAAGLDPLLANFISFTLLGLIVAAVGGLIAKRGVVSLAHDDFTPRKSIASAKQTAEWAKEKVL